MRRVWVLLSWAMLAAGPVQAQRSPQGWTFTWTLTSTVRGREQEAGAMVFDVTLWNGAVRIMPRGNQPAVRALLGDESSVVLLRAGESQLTVVNARKREALVATPDELAGFSGGAATMQLVVSEVSSRTLPGGTATALDGYTARRVTLEQQYTLSLRTPQMQRALRVSETTTLDLSEALAARDPGFRVFLQQFLRALGKPGPVVSALRAQEGTLPKGAALRTMTTTLTSTGADTLRAESIGAMSGLQRVPVDTSTFRVPGDFRVTELRRLLQLRGRP